MVDMQPSEQSLTLADAQPARPNFQSHHIVDEDAEVDQEEWDNLVREVGGNEKVAIALRRFFVMLVYGIQGRGKSTLANALFDTNFITSDDHTYTESDRISTTHGVQATYIPAVAQSGRNRPCPGIFLDFEGILAADKNDTAFRKYLGSFALQSANVMLVLTTAEDIRLGKNNQTLSDMENIIKGVPASGGDEPDFSLDQQFLSILRRRRVHIIFLVRYVGRKEIKNMQLGCSTEEPGFLERAEGHITSKLKAQLQDMVAEKFGAFLNQAQAPEFTPSALISSSAFLIPHTDYDKPKDDPAYQSAIAKVRSKIVDLVLKVSEEDVARAGSPLGSPLSLLSDLLANLERSKQFSAGARYLHNARNADQQQIECHDFLARVSNQLVNNLRRRLIERSKAGPWDAYAREQCRGALENLKTRYVGSEFSKMEKCHPVFLQALQNLATDADRAWNGVKVQCEEEAARLTRLHNNEPTEENREKAEKARARAEETAQQPDISWWTLSLESVLAFTGKLLKGGVEIIAALAELAGAWNKFKTSDQQGAK